MCPICLTTATVVAASTGSGAGVLGFISVKYRALLRARREPPTSQRNPGPARVSERIGRQSW
jgi:hypothetical protein